MRTPIKLDGPTDAMIAKEQEISQEQIIEDFHEIFTHSREYID